MHIHGLAERGTVDRVPVYQTVLLFNSLWFFLGYRVSYSNAADSITRSSGSGRKFGTGNPGFYCPYWIVFSYRSDGERRIF